MADLTGQDPVRDQLDALMSKHAHNFARWKSEMDWGWSLLFYGVGSKREVRAIEVFFCLICAPCIGLRYLIRPPRRSI